MALQFPQESCPFCLDGKLIPYADGTREFMHKRKVRRMSNLHYCICNQCGTRGITEDQSEENIRLIAQFENGLNDYISKKNIRRIRDKYRLSQAEAGLIFGCGKSYFSKWETGDSAPTGSAAILLKAALKHTDVMQRLADDAGVAISIPPQLNKEANSFAALPSDAPPITPQTRILKQATTDEPVSQSEGFGQSLGQAGTNRIEVRSKLVRIK